MSMYPRYARGPNYFHRIHFVLAKFKDRGWFSARQAAITTYFGAGRPHRQQHKRVRQMLDRYVTAGILVRNDHIAACPLYRHRDVTLDQVDRALVEEFQRHAYRWGPTPCDSIEQELLDRHLDKLVPRDADVTLYDESGVLLGPKDKALRDRMKLQPKPRPKRTDVFKYLSR